MSLLKRFVPPFAAVLTSPRTQGVARQAYELGRRLRGAPHVVRYFHQVDDPYSALVVQVLPRFVERFDVRLDVHLVGPPTDEIAPQRERLRAFAMKDASDIAPYLGLDFEVAKAPSSDRVARAQAVLQKMIDDGTFVARAPAIMRALFRTDAPIEGDGVEPRTAEGEAIRKKLGHYNGAMLHYGGGWYWGVDRLHYLEDRWTALGLRRSGDGPIVTPPAFDGVVDGERLKLEFFASARSPYSYLALVETFALESRLPVDVVLRPVLPMVMRGLPVPFVKRRYILLDAAREAARIGVPFGYVSDPVGEPIERLYALLPWARNHGVERELFVAFCRGVWSEGIDGGTDEGLARIFANAGLDLANAEADESWRTPIEANQDAMLAAGLWGVPSFVITGGGEPFRTWGRDRIWLLEAEIRRRLQSNAECSR